MIYYNDGEWEYPYLYNLIDEYRHLAKYNNGQSYNMMFVGPGWLNKLGRWEAPYDLLKKSYEDGMAYYGALKKKGELIDMTMAEYAHYYREHRSYQEPERALWKDILYGSSKQYFWYSDPQMRTCLDFNQGGAMIDLRPCVARLPWKCGIGTDHIYDASYPYLIQANYRAGFFTHYAGAGTLKSCKISYKGESTDLALCRTLGRYEKVGEDTLITANPVNVVLAGLSIDIESSFLFKKGTGEIVTTRKILNDLHGEKVSFEEYFCGAFGTNEYQADMQGVTLGVDEKSLQYAYKCRSIVGEKATLAYARVPQVSTQIEMSGDNDFATVNEGIAFSPDYRISLTKSLSKGGISTCLKLRKAD